MAGWTLFFVFLGILCFTALLFRVLDRIEQPPMRRPRRTAARWET